MDITYNIQNDCGLNADSVMNTSEGSPLKSGLIQATTIICNQILFQYPLSVQIDNIIDMPANCPTGTNCLLVISTINTVVMPSDDADTLKQKLVDGIEDSFQDGSFFESVPQEAAECPAGKRGKGWMMKIGQGKK